ncbi:MAG TPA: glycine cleavage system aminomethyltransferase GcvT [Caulobacteraceae bacterium]|nr:glycine cleavage system aminomethyltransferase GcvT [Caulobacteraceae bacterium]
MAEAHEPLKSTVLGAAAEARGARMAPFAGYLLPVSFSDGILKESLWCRTHAALFDVSHMGPAFIELSQRTGDPEADHAAIARLIEPLVCGDLARLKRGQLRYTLLMNAAGGIDDDLIFGRPSADPEQGKLMVVANAGAKEADFDRIRKALGGKGRLARADDGALLALQGPQAAAVIAGLLPGAPALAFMELAAAPFESATLWVSRSGYTGEDGFELLIPRALANSFFERLLADERVRPAGLGARDALRLEAGLPLHGHDIDAATSPVEAGLSFAIAKRRAAAGAFPGAARVAREIEQGPARRRVGLAVLEGAPAREGAPILADGRIVGAVTSGGFSPTLGAPIAMGYVPPALAALETGLAVEVRGRRQRARVTALPFVPHRYHRRPA